VRSGMRSRRDVRSEDKAAVRRPRSLVLAAAAAVVVGVVGLGGGAFVLLRGDDDAVRSGAASLPGTPASIVTASGREYTASTLVAQVRALLGLPSASPGTASSGRSTARPSGSAHPSATTRPAAPTATAGTVADPAQLESCLAGLVGARNRRPLVVDLARWQGRDAAVIVLPGLSGGYDIWVVPRRCSAGSELPIAFKSVPQ